jgi:hypothetical protein
MTSAYKVCRIALLALAAAAAGGCSAQQAPRPKPVPVHGLVRYNGKPLDGAHVIFTNTEAGLSADGTTDADGKFSLTTFRPDDGAVPGHYHVTVTKAQAPTRHGAANAPPVFRPGGGAPHPRWLIPQKYANLATSGLTADVADGGSEQIVVELRGPA